MAENDSGNVSAIREALVQCELFLGNVSRHAHPTLNPGDKCIACDGVDELRGMVNAAIAKPARNCDMIPADEWLALFTEYCHQYSHCSSCPIHAKWDFSNGKKVSCLALWAVMPHKTEEASYAK